MHNLRNCLGVGGEAVGDLVRDRWTLWVDTRKKGGYGGQGHTKERAVEVEEEGSPPPKRPKKSPPNGAPQTTRGGEPGVAR